VQELPDDQGTDKCPQRAGHRQGKGEVEGEPAQTQCPDKGTRGHGYEVAVAPARDDSQGKACRRPDGVKRAIVNRCRRPGANLSQHHVNEHGNCHPEELEEPMQHLSIAPAGGGNCLRHRHFNP